MIQIGYSSDDRKSTKEIKHLQSRGKSRKQLTVVLSSCEAEYMDMCTATQEAKSLTMLTSMKNQINQLRSIMLNRLKHIDWYELS